MILALFRLDSPRQVKRMQPFIDLLQDRYGEVLLHPLNQLDPLTWHTALKPFHSGYFPFIALDMMIELRGLPAQMIFAHDLLKFGRPGEVLELDAPTLEEVQRLLGTLPAESAQLEFKGFGPRIDIALNIISTLYIDILGHLTKVEAEVLQHLRSLQYEKFEDPSNVRTFGLQKRVAALLDKSPVAVHKSLRSAKYELLADTATAMKNLIV